MLSFNDRLRFEKFFRGKRSEWMVLEQLNSAGNLTFKLYEFFSLLIRDDYKTPPKLWSVSVKRLNRMKNKDTKYSRSKDFYQQNKSSFTDFDNQKNRDPSSQSTFSIENKKTSAPLVRSSSLPTGSLEFDNKGDGHIPDPVSLGKYSGQKLEVSLTLLSCSCTHISELFVDKVMVPSFFEHIRMLDAHPAVNESDDEDYSWVSKILEFRSLSK
ncbi:hypothetical protein AX774_g527 [Zancudomyces culisetae]|uniref:Uncharacterized protein n=1 Tax=Zancudomyces culisetae TaxID=1213189 RepID=A0A1R1PY80_ZANCU|nr:hypothetical protein AX774_g527 [Zancudomyces culisetae]|eukprot:OMH85910.1 hypothetical protein AX774_g527 [Zancudomyces culisetae]